MPQRCRLPPIDAVGVTNQRESVLVWERRSGEPVGPAITWQCRRTAPFCETLRHPGLEARIRADTGLPIDPLFSASKARWLLDHARDGTRRAMAGELCIGHSRQLGTLEPHRRRRTCVRRVERLAHAAAEPAHPVLGPGLLEVFGVPAAALPTSERRAVSSGYRWKRTSRGRHSDRRPDRRFACGALRSSALSRWRRQGHVRNRFIPDAPLSTPVESRPGCQPPSPG